MAQYILRKNEADDSDKSGYVMSAEEIGHLPGVRILEATTENTLLVESEQESLQGYASRLRGWLVSPVIVYEAPWGNDQFF